MIFLLIRGSVTNASKGSNKPPDLIKKKKKTIICTQYYFISLIYL